MTQKTITILITLALFTGMLAACTPKATTPGESEQAKIPEAAPAETSEAILTWEPITLTDDLERQVSLVSQPQRVVSLAPSNTEMLFALGAVDQVVGRDEFSDYPPETVELQSVGGGWGEYNMEAIIALNPDLVLAAEINTPEQVQALEELGLTVFMLGNPTDLEGMYDNLMTVAILTGHVEEANNLITSLKERVADVLATVATSQERPSVFYELDASDPNIPWTAGPGTFIDILINMAGGKNIGAMLEGAWAQISIEALVEQDPDIILLGDSAYGITPEMIVERAGWESLSAVLNNLVYPFDDDLVSRPGPRLVDGLETLAELLHPELFK
ncbi:MAG: cobalamin-binding protein [Chloroflexota bacterium]